MRIRLIHAQIRRLLRESDDWDTAAWGEPLSAAHLGFALTAFSARLLAHMKRLGASYTKEEAASFMAVWRYVGWLMGIPETILIRDEAEALKLFEIGNLCEPDPDIESIAMANSLVNSAPLLAEMTDPEVRRKFSKYIYGVSRAVIGKQVGRPVEIPAHVNSGSFGMVQNPTTIRASHAKHNLAEVAVAVAYRSHHVRPVQQSPGSFGLR